MTMTNDNKKPDTGKKTKLTAHVTFLEMTHAPSRIIPLPTRPRIALMKAENIPTSFYRFLYEMVGKEYHWEERRNLIDEKLDEIINSDTTEISILYVDGCPGGFFELNTSNAPEKVEIVYLGIAKDYQGFGLGKWFMSSAISAAWLHKPQRVFLETNTLDHPAALPLYQKLGFSPVGTGEVEIEVWE